MSGLEWVHDVKIEKIPKKRFKKEGPFEDVCEVCEGKFQLLQDELCIVMLKGEERIRSRQPFPLCPKCRFGKGGLVITAKVVIRTKHNIPKKYLEKHPDFVADLIKRTIETNWGYGIYRLRDDERWAEAIVYSKGKYGELLPTKAEITEVSVVRGNDGKNKDTDI